MGCTLVFRLTVVPCSVVSQIYAIGGKDNNGAALASVEQIDLRAETGWTLADSSLSFATHSAASVWLDDATVAVMGGIGIDGQPSTVVQTTDIRTGRWQIDEALALPAASAGHSAIRLA